MTSIPMGKIPTDFTVVLVDPVYMSTDCRNILSDLIFKVLRRVFLEFLFLVYCGTVSLLLTVDCLHLHFTVLLCVFGNGNNPMGIP